MREAQDGQVTHAGLELFNTIIQSCSSLHEMTGHVGDVIFLYPLMLHAATRDGPRLPRSTTNPPILLTARIRRRTVS